MRLKRFAAALATTAVAAGGTVVTGAALASPAEAAGLGCVFLVKHRAPVKSKPAKKGKVVDRLRRGDRTLGSCRRYGQEKNWHRVVGTRDLTKGYTRQKNLQKLGTTEDFGI
ncbi:hypothetical protein GCM10010156_24960 [Planobispora rosea]|uniref:Uncharacterized protein n=1 Tax=Planobispora rosea TaxID=35762 RepID=A0A8J3WDI0_PLARO|nr:hypothetical protein [Planobispora rosea]GGS65050.1 hypothetical protein GCM10010156_24960 [Planobispora rosea]GIH84857.1 hypothetical protein Pro02_32650 [Planobispora rosea]